VADAFVQQPENPFIAVLLLLGAVSYATDDAKGTIVVSVMVVVSVVMRYLQECRSSKAADTLRSLVLTTATVSRDGQRCEVPFEDLVPDDIVHLSAGDKKVPFIQSTAALPVLLLTTAVIAVGIYLPFSRLENATGMARLPWIYFPWLAVTLLAYGALTQGVKTWYIRRFHAWL
jgi:hypothetical protein